MKIKLSTLEDWLKITDRISEASTTDDSSSQNEDSSQDEEGSSIEESRSSKFKQKISEEDIYDFDEKYFQSSIDLGKLF